MNLLLDTHILLWAAADTLPKEAAMYLHDMRNTLYFSSASIWEIVIKNGLSRTDFVIDPPSLYRGLIDAGYKELNVTGQHTLLVSALPVLHKDPFDRLLLAQSASEGITLLTADETIAGYPGSVILVM